MKIGYIRTSTGDQVGAGQREALKAAAGCERIFHDKGVSGGAVSKPQLERALKAASEGDALVVTRLDRLARSMKFLIEDVERIGGLGIDFVSLHEAIDSTAPGGRLFFYISAAGWPATGNHRRTLARHPPDARWWHDDHSRGADRRSPASGDLSAA